MSQELIDNVARQAANGLTRRASLLTLGGAGLAALLASSAADAGKKRRKSRKKANKTCKRQVGQCNGYFAPLCDDEGAPENCAELTAACCELLKECQAADFIDCFFELMRGPEEDPER